MLIWFTFILIQFTNLHHVYCQTTFCTPGGYYCGRELSKLNYTNTVEDNLYKCTPEGIGQLFSVCGDGACVTKSAEKASFCKCVPNFAYCGYELIKLGWEKISVQLAQPLEEHKIYECKNVEQIEFKMACPSHECLENKNSSSVCSTTSSNCTSIRKYCGYELSRMGYYDIENPHILHKCYDATAYIEKDCYNGCIAKGGQSVCDTDTKAAMPQISESVTSPPPVTPHGPLSPKVITNRGRNSFHCGFSLDSNLLPNLSPQSMYRIGADGQPKLQYKCGYGCIQTSVKGFCKPSCELNQIYCGHQLKEDFEQYGNMTVVDAALYRCNGGTSLQLVKTCEVRCVIGKSNPFCSNWMNGTLDISVDSVPHQKGLKIDMKNETGTVRFAFKPFSPHTTAFYINLGPNLLLTVTNRDVFLSGKGASYFTKNEIKTPESKLLHFNATDQMFWISICKRQPFIKVGYGYLMDLNTLWLFGTDYQNAILDIMTAITYIALNNEIASFTSAPKYSIDLIVLDPSPIVAEKVNPLSNQGQHSTYLATKLPKKARELFDQIKETDHTESYVDLVDAINYSLDMDGCSLNRKLKSKNNFGTTDNTTSYIRVTLGADMCTSPGVSFVLEIWPKGHHSPIHNHGNTVAIIKILYGSLRSIWYNPLTKVSNEKPQIIAEQYLHMGNITWMHPEYYQTHQLFNIEMNTAAITIQSYAYLDSDTLRDENFNYIVPEKDNQLHFFTPNSDYEFRNFVRIVRDEHIHQTCSPSD